MIHDKLTLGSLFDGSGGFPLGGLLSGITPVWASEIEPFPIRVTTKRLPFMKHYGDVSRMDGAEVELSLIHIYPVFLAGQAQWAGGVFLQAPSRGGGTDLPADFRHHDFHEIH